MTLIVVVMIANVPRNEFNDLFLHVFDETMEFRVASDFMVDNLTESTVFTSRSTPVIPAESAIPSSCGRRMHSSNGGDSSRRRSTFRRSRTR